MRGTQSASIRLEDLLPPPALPNRPLHLGDLDQALGIMPSESPAGKALDTIAEVQRLKGALEEVARKSETIEESMIAGQEETATTMAYMLDVMEEMRRSLADLRDRQENMGVVVRCWRGLRGLPRILFGRL